MVHVQASWKDQSGALRTIRARMENTSAGGACIRTPTHIAVGSTLIVACRWEKFSGTVRHCSGDGSDYLVGIQRDVASNPIAPQKSVKTNRPAVSQVSAQPSRATRETKPGGILADGRSAERASLARSTRGATATPPREIHPEVDSVELPRIAESQQCNGVRRTPVRTNQPPKTNENGKERTSMRSKWFNLALWHHNDRENLGGGHNESENGQGQKPNQAPQPHVRRVETPAAGPSVRGTAGLQLELLSMEDIYRNAGIVGPRKGYTVNKISEMLESEHIRGLAKDVKAAAVRMALDAAGIPVSEVLRDAKVRQDCLDAHEAEQRKQAEAAWARKAEENVQIQAEFERVREHYTALLRRNADSVAREKAAFSSWLANKQKEFQTIAEAAELCSKPAAPASSGESVPSTTEVALVEATVKPAQFQH
jgi:hypothetical protein